MNDYFDMTLRVINGRPSKVRFWAGGKPNSWLGDWLFFYEEDEQLYVTYGDLTIPVSGAQAIKLAVFVYDRLIYDEKYT